MADTLQTLADAALRWAQQGVAVGWLTREDVEPFRQVERHTPESLFSEGGQRPLVVAFFGGTGVGKSSLLNRLAGQAIARTGVERPTSREVSVYLHESVQLQHLPPELPLDTVKIARHRENAWRAILWIDMPDMDSTEHANRDLVLAWLPHIDVLVYVVSPERYRDEKAWRLLQSQGREHAWLFTMNQWDRAQAVQLEDFGRQLARAGFADPVVLRTDCREPAEDRQPDDFDQLAAIIQSLCDGHTVSQLERRIRQARFDQLIAALEIGLKRLRGGGEEESLRQRWETLWTAAESDLLQGLQWPLQQYARSFVAREGNPLRTRPKLAAPADGKPASVYTLWDDWAQTVAGDALERLAVDAAQAGHSLAALRAGTEKIAQQLPQRIMRQTQQGLRQALANPGNALQRVLLRLTAFGSAVFPLAALGWVGYQAFTAYYVSAETQTHYLGLDFAVHSGLLVAIAWLLPWFLHRLLTPSAERVAVKGLCQGLTAGLAQVAVEAEALLADARQQRQAYVHTGDDLAKRCRAAEPVAVLDKGLLGRLLQNRPDAL